MDLNEEIIAQNEELAVQRTELETINKELEEKSLIISDINRLLQEQIMLLEAEVEKRTQEIKLAYEKLRDRNSRLEQYTYFVSHNLRGPLATLLGLVSLFEICDSSEYPEIQRMIKKTTEQLDLMVKGMNNILDINKNYSVIKELINPLKIFEEVKKLLSNEINASGAIFHLTNECKEGIWAVPIFLNNILLNLIQNSIKFSHKDKPPEIKLHFFDNENVTVIEIEDNGLGFDAERYKEKLFQPFKKFHFNKDGIGVGLYMIKEQVEIMDGKIEIFSKVNEGTVVRIQLPKKSV